MKYQKISHKSLIIQEVLSVILWFVISIFPFIYLDRYTKLWIISLLVLFLIYLFFACFYFPVKYRNTRYYLNSSKIYFQTGAIIKKQSVMTRLSVISVVLVCNPWTPLFNIASVSINAPGALIRIPYLEYEIAKAIVNELTPLSDL